MRWSVFICLICKIPNRVSVCESCWAQLHRLQTPYVRREEPFRIRSLFTWGEDSGRALPWLLHSLKGSADPERWLPLAQLFVRQFRSSPTAQLLPVPGQTADHAAGWAQALSLASGLKLAPPLLRRLNESSWIQKRLVRRERQKIRFAATQPCMKYTPLVLVDDVITTGSTARAVYTALNRPLGFEVWCLVDRRPCGGSW